MSEQIKNALSVLCFWASWILFLACFPLILAVVLNFFEVSSSFARWFDNSTWIPSLLAIVFYASSQWLDFLDDLLSPE